jgi:hypothetical protein
LYYINYGLAHQHLAKFRNGTSNAKQ